MGQWGCPVVAGAVGGVLQQGEGCFWSSAVLDSSSCLAGWDWRSLKVSPLLKAFCKALSPADLQAGKFAALKATVAALKKFLQDSVSFPKAGLSLLLKAWVLPQPSPGRPPPLSDVGAAMGSGAPSGCFRGCGRVPGSVLMLGAGQVRCADGEGVPGPGCEWSLSDVPGEPEQCLSDPGRQLV